MDQALDCFLLKLKVCVLRRALESFTLACVLWFQEVIKETDGGTVFDEVFHQASIVSNPESILHHIHSLGWMHHNCIAVQEVEALERLHTDVMFVKNLEGQSLLR